MQTFGEEDTNWIAEEWRLAISQWTASVNLADFHAKRRGLYALSRLQRVRQYIYKGFERRGALLRGFRKFVRRIEDQRALRIRCMLLKKWSWNAWKLYLKAIDQSLAPVPIQNGCLVFACFKWMSISFQDEHPTYPANNQVDQLQDAAHTLDMLRRFRSYTQGFIQLPNINNALHVHAIALLDAFQIKRIFTAWKSRTIQIQMFVATNIIRRVRKSVHQWLIFAIRKRKLRYIVALISSRRTFRILDQITSAWKISFTLFRHIRCTYIPRRLRLYINNLQVHRRFTISQREFMKQAIHHSLRQNFRYWLKRLFHIRLNRLFQPSSKILKAIPTIIADEKKIISKLYQRSDPASNYDHRVTLHRQLWNLLIQKCHPLLINIHRMFQKWQCSINQDENPWNSSRSRRRRYFTIYSKYHQQRLLKSYLSIWLMSIPQMRQDCASFTQKMRLSVHIGIIKQFVYLKRWILYIRRRQYFASRYYYIQYQRCQQKQRVLFGAWYITYLRHSKLSRSYNKVICLTFGNLKWHAFFAWKNSFQRSLLIRTQQFEELRLRNQRIQLQLQERYIQKTKQSKREVLRLWSNCIRQKRCARLFVLAVWHVYQQHKTSLFLSMWKRIHNLETIVICLQKLWRGFQTRYLTHRKEHGTMKWYHQCIPLYFQFYRRQCMHRIFHGWKTFMCYTRKRQWQMIHRLNLSRNYQKWKVCHLLHRYYHFQIYHRSHQFWKHRRLQMIFQKLLYNRNHYLVITIITKRIHRLACHSVITKLAIKNRMAKLYQKAIQLFTKHQCKRVLSILTVRKQKQKITSLLNKRSNLRFLRPRFSLFLQSIAQSIAIPTSNRKHQLLDSTMASRPSTNSKPILPYSNMISNSLDKRHHREYKQKVLISKSKRKTIRYWYKKMSLSAMTKRLLQSYQCYRFYKPCMDTWIRKIQRTIHQNNVYHLARVHYRRHLLFSFFHTIYRAFRTRRSYNQSLEHITNYRHEKLVKESFTIFLYNLYRRKRLRNIAHNHIGLRATFHRLTKRKEIQKESHQHPFTKTPRFSLTNTNNGKYWRGNSRAIASASSTQGLQSSSLSSSHAISSDQPDLLKTPHNILSAKYMLSQWISRLRQRNRRYRKVTWILQEKKYTILRIYLRKLSKRIYQRKKRHLIHQSHRSLSRRHILSTVLHTWKYITYVKSLKHLRSVLLIKRLRTMFHNAFQALRIYRLRQRTKPSRGGRTLRHMSCFKCHRVFQKWLVSTRHSINQKCIQRNIQKYYCILLKKRNLYYLWRYSIVHKKMRKIYRRFSLCGVLSQWLRMTIESISIRKTNHYLQNKIMHRSLRSHFHTWKRFTLYALKIKECFYQISIQTVLQKKDKAFQSWLLALAQEKMISKVQTIQRKHTLYTKRFAFNQWQHAVIISELKTLQIARMIFHAWSNYTKYKQLKSESISKGQQFYRRKIIHKGFHSLYVLYFNNKFCFHNITIGKKFYQRTRVFHMFSSWRSQSHIQYLQRSQRKNALLRFYDLKMDSLCKILKSKRQMQLKQSNRMDHRNSSSKLEFSNSFGRNQVMNVSTELFDRGKFTFDELTLDLPVKAKGKTEKREYSSTYRTSSIEIAAKRDHSMKEQKIQQYVQEMQLFHRYYYKMIILKAFHKLRRVAIIEMRLRRRQKCGIIFDAWKRCSFSIKHARLAFLGRMTHVLHFHRLKTSFADLKFNARNNKLIRNITLYMSLTQQSKLFQAWRRLFQQKRLCMSVIDKMLLNMTKFSMHRAWNHWRVVIGPARRIQQIVIMKYGWFRWKKLFIAVCYRNKRLYQMCFQHWMKLNKGIEERAKQLRRNRNIVVKVVHRMQRGVHSLMARSFNTWKVYMHEMNQYPLEISRQKSLYAKSVESLNKQSQKNTSLLNNGRDRHHTHNEESKLACKPPESKIDLNIPLTPWQNEIRNIRTPLFSIKHLNMFRSVEENAESK